MTTQHYLTGPHGEGGRPDRNVDVPDDDAAATPGNGLDRMDVLRWVQQQFRGAFPDDRDVTSYDDLKNAVAVLGLLDALFPGIVAQTGGSVRARPTSDADIRSNWSLVQACARLLEIPIVLNTSSIMADRKARHRASYQMLVIALYCHSLRTHQDFSVELVEPIDDAVAEYLQSSSSIERLMQPQDLTAHQHAQHCGDDAAASIVSKLSSSAHMTPRASHLAESTAANVSLELSPTSSRRTEEVLRRHGIGYSTPTSRREKEERTFEDTNNGVVATTDTTGGDEDEVARLRAGLAASEAQVVLLREELGQLSQLAAKQTRRSGQVHDARLQWESLCLHRARCHAQIQWDRKRAEVEGAFEANVAALVGEQHRLLRHETEGFRAQVLSVVNDMLLVSHKDTLAALKAQERGYQEMLRETSELKTALIQHWDQIAADVGMHGEAASSMADVATRVHLEEASSMLVRQRLQHARALEELHARSQGDPTQHSGGGSCSLRTSVLELQKELRAAEALREYLLEKDRKAEEQAGGGDSTPPTGDADTMFWGLVRDIDALYAQLVRAVEADVRATATSNKTHNALELSRIVERTKAECLEQSALESVRLEAEHVSQTIATVRQVMRDCSKHVAPTVFADDSAHNTLRDHSRRYHKYVGTLQLRESVWQQIATRQRNAIEERIHLTTAGEVRAAYSEAQRLQKVLHQQGHSQGHATAGDEGFEDPTVSMLGSLHVDLDDQFRALQQTIDVLVRESGQHRVACVERHALEKEITMEHRTMHAIEQHVAMRLDADYSPSQDTATAATVASGGLFALEKPRTRPWYPGVSALTLAVPAHRQRPSHDPNLSGGQPKPRSAAASTSFTATTNNNNSTSVQSPATIDISRDSSDIIANMFTAASGSGAGVVPLPQPRSAAPTTAAMPDDDASSSSGGDAVSPQRRRIKQHAISASRTIAEEIERVRRFVVQSTAASANTIS